jgi:hypothetical protein
MAHGDANDIVSGWAMTDATPTYHLENWSVRTGGDAFTPPERVLRCLVGFRVEDSEEIITSPIDSVDGRSVRTMSGSVYILGAPDPAWLRWMLDNGVPYDDERPIRARTSKTV